MTLATHDIFGQWIAVVATLGGIVLGGWLGRRGRRRRESAETAGLAPLCDACGALRRPGRYCPRCGAKPKEAGPSKPIADPPAFGNVLPRCNCCRSVMIYRIAQGKCEYVCEKCGNTFDATNAPPAFLPKKCDRCHSTMVLYVDDDPAAHPARIWRCKCGNAIYADALPVPAPDPRPILNPNWKPAPLPLCPRCKTLIEPRNWRDKWTYWICPNCKLEIKKRRPLPPIPYPDNTRPVKCDLCQSEMYPDVEGYPDGRPRPVLRCQCGNTYDLPRDRRH